MYTPPVSLVITDADSGQTEVYCLRNGQYVGSNSGKQFVAELFPTASPESVSTTLANFQSGQVPANWFSEWSSTQTSLSYPLILEAINYVNRVKDGGWVQGGHYHIPPH